MKIEVFSRKPLIGRPKWFFRIRAMNGQIVAQSEGYSRRLDAVSTAHSIRSGLANAEIKDA
jgi:uncharacterized protein YegP (UPF0339 family)